MERRQAEEYVIGRNDGHVAVDPLRVADNDVELVLLDRSGDMYRVKKRRLFVVDVVMMN